MSTENRIKGKRNRKTGECAETLVMKAMEKMGYQCIEKVETGFGIVRKGTQIVSAYPKRSVSGDIKAIGHGGKAVHVEVKYREGKLKWTDFSPHQIEALNDVTNARGEALVAWVTSLLPFELFLLLWPITTLKKGKALSEEEAENIKDEHFGFVNGNHV